MKQKEIIQPGAISKLIKLLEDYNNINIFLIHGNQSYINSGAQKIFSKILKDYSIIEYEKTNSIPSLEEAEIGYQLFSRNKCNLIISVGGGSVIDTGKLIKFKVLSGENSDLLKTPIPLIAIPTTAGSGSEATHFAVVYVKGEKQSIASNDLLPDLAIVDSHLLNGQSKYQMAVSGIDAFAQGIESYWNINSTNKSMVYSEKAIKLVWENLEKAINGDIKSRAELAIGSNYAGKAINITKTTAPHALSYGFTSMLNMPHGHAVALFLPYFTRYHAELNINNCRDQKGSEHVRLKIEKLASFLNTTIEEIDIVIAQFIKTIGLEINFKHLNIATNKYLESLKGASIERLKNNPGVINEEVFIQIYNYNNDYLYEVIK